MVAVRVVVMGHVLDVGEEGGEALDEVTVVRPDIGEVAQVIGDLRELHVLIATLGAQPLDLITHAVDVPVAGVDRTSVANDSGAVPEGTAPLC